MKEHETVSTDAEERNKRLLEASTRFTRGEISREEYQRAERNFGVDIRKILTVFAQRRIEHEAKEPKR